MLDGGRTQPVNVTCLARDTVRASGGASLVSVVPAPSVAPRPTVTHHPGGHVDSRLGWGAPSGPVPDGGRGWTTAPQ